MVVLSDNETWTSSGYVYILNDEADYPDGDADQVTEIEAKIHIEDLIEAYNKVHGTKY
jgi:hypothetical protein